MIIRIDIRKWRLIASIRYARRCYSLPRVKIIRLILYITRTPHYATLQRLIFAAVRDGRKLKRLCQ